MTDPDGKRLLKGIDLERLVEKCKDRGVDVHDVIAMALTNEMREQAETSGMTMKEQASLAWKIIDKSEPSKQAVKHSGDPENPIEVVRIERQIIDTQD